MHPMYRWAQDLFPLNRSLTGPGVRETLAYLRTLIPELKLQSIPSRTKVFDWEVPQEWHVAEAYIANEHGHRIIDFAKNNLHLVGYSVPVEGWFSRAELDKHLHSLPNTPDAIPYLTSYYKPRWGFCVSQRQREELTEDRYFIKIDSRFFDGVMDYADLVISGDSGDEVLLSTYICHPSMANNEVSGPVVTAALARWLLSLPDRRYTYRIVFVPETIGAIAYLSLHHEQMKARTTAGFVVTCVGDERAYSYLPSLQGDTLADRAARAAFGDLGIIYDTYDFLQRGSDERQYCSPGISLPVCSIMRSKYGTYPEYHTSLDNLELISQAGLEGAYNVYERVIRTLECNRRYRATVMGEPQLGKRGLYPVRSDEDSPPILNFFAYADGSRDLMEIASRMGVGVLEAAELAQSLEEHGLVAAVD